MCLKGKSWGKGIMWWWWCLPWMGTRAFGNDAREPTTVIEARQLFLSLPCRCDPFYLVEVTLRPVGAAIVEKPVTKKKARRETRRNLPHSSFGVQCWMWQQRFRDVSSVQVPHTMTVAELKRLAHLLFKQVRSCQLLPALVGPTSPGSCPLTASCLVQPCLTRSPWID